MSTVADPAPGPLPRSLSEERSDETKGAAVDRNPVTRPRIRLIATDLDGTLLDPAGRVSARTRAALDAARAAGIVVVPVTARQPIGLRAIAALTSAPQVPGGIGEIGKIWEINGDV